MAPGEITDKLGLNQLRARKVPASLYLAHVKFFYLFSDITSSFVGLNLIVQWYVQATCATQGEGLYEGLDWLSKELSERRG